ncbi:transglycosylase domain-containing protein [Cytobacillus sp. Hm23]
MASQSQSRTARKQAERNHKSKQKPKKSIFQFIKKLILVFFTLGIIGAIVGAIAFYVIIKDVPPLDEQAFQASFSSKVFDKDGNEFAELGIEKRTYVKYNEIPTVLQDAFLAVEDARFLEHHGIDPIRIGGAVLANITEGFGAEGASTITQQVVKNYVLTSEKKISRKVQEAWLAYKLEQIKSKEEILELYLNKIFLGGSTYGVGKAAEVYFGLDKDNLNEMQLHQAALLAGMTQSPNNYNPIKNPEAAEERRNVVLSLMAQHGFISAEQAEQAKAIPVEESLNVTTIESEPYDSFLDYVIEEINESGDYDLYSGGLEIYTTLDTEAQKYTNELLQSNNVVNFPNENLQAGITLLDTKTGQIRAIGGGRNQDAARGWNYAIDTKAQPGSSIKPVLDYGPAIEHLKWSTYEQINDEQMTYADSNKQIYNWYDGYRGWMSMRYAIEQSVNVPAVKALREVGLDKARDFAVGLGIPLEKQIYEPYAIGGFSTGVSTLDMAGAFSAFGNEGFYNQPHAVTKIVFPDGREIDLTPETEEAMSDYTAFMITDMLKSVVTNGTGRDAFVSNAVPVAGKTGSTNYPIEEIQKYGLPENATKDVWFAGYTTEYTAAIWTGFNRISEDAYFKSVDEEKIARKLFKNLFTHISGGESADFTVPNSVVQQKVEKGSNPAKLPSEFTPQNEIVYEYFVKGTEPTKVSEKYDKIDPPNGFEALYDERANALQLLWDYTLDGPEEKLSDISFEIKQSIDEGPYEVIGTTKEFSYLVPDPIEGAIYSYQISAVSDSNPENRSDPLSASVEIPIFEEEIENPFDDLFDEEPGTDDEGEIGDPLIDEGDHDERPPEPPPSEEDNNEE